MSIVFAHVGQPIAPHDIWTEWAPDPFSSFVIAILAIMYVWGVRSLWLHAGKERVITTPRVVAGAAGFAALIIALVSPLDVAASGLFTLHMVQHLLLVLVAAPLLVVGRVHLALLWSLRLETRQKAGIMWAGSPRFRRAACFIAAPATAWILHTLAIWLWHSPSLYDLAANSELWHA